MPVTIPPVPMVATAVFVLLHVPLPVASLRVIANPLQTAIGPAITAGNGIKTNLAPGVTALNALAVQVILQR